MDSPVPIVLGMKNVVPFAIVQAAARMRETSAMNVLSKAIQICYVRKDNTTSCDVVHPSELHLWEALKFVHNRGAALQARSNYDIRSS